MSPLDALMRAAFAPLVDSEQAMLGIQHIVRLPDGGNAKPVTPKRWRAGEEVPAVGLHYNCGVFRLGATRATLNEATRCMIVMLDDLGDMPGKSKASLEPVLALPSAVQPHVVIATRRDGEHVNCQACWFIVPVAIDAACALVRAAATAGLGDPGASGGVRWARLEGSIKVGGDGFAAEMILANLDRPRIGIGALADALDVGGFMGAARAPSHVNNRGELPDAALVRKAMAAIANDLDHDGWVRLGLALKACSGPPPVLADAEDFALFDDFSRRHDSYNARDTRAAWETFRPTGALPGRPAGPTKINFAGRCGSPVRTPVSATWLNRIGPSLRAFFGWRLGPGTLPISTTTQI